MTIKLSFEDWNNIKEEIQNGTPVPVLAKKYKVTRSHIYLKLRQDKEKSKGFFQRIWEKINSQ
jgi:Mor family transcriptional regulator